MLRISALVLFFCIEWLNKGSIFVSNKTRYPKHYQLRKNNALNQSITAVNDVIKTFDRHLEGIYDAIITQASSAKHENINGKIQSVIAKARGFLNFKRFGLNVIFYFGKLNLQPQKIY